MSPGTFISVEDPRWSAFLSELPHDLYHTAAYCRSAWEEGSTRVVAYAWESDGVRAFIPLVISACPSEVCGDGGVRYDARSPYGYGGPLISTPVISTPGVSEELVLGDLIRDCKGLGIATVFLRISQLVHTGFLGSCSQELCSCHQLGTTYAISLSDCKGEQELLQKYRDNHRRSIRKLLGAPAVVAQFDLWEDLNCFIALYHDHMQRLGAASSYYFPTSYFLSLQEHLPNHVHLLSVRRSGEYIGGVLFFAYNNLIHYHLTGCTLEERQGSLPKLMIHLIAEWARSRGASVMHLGGGLGGRDDSLAHFKRGFTDISFPFLGCEIVVDEAWYRDAAARVGVSREQASYFPAYRSPR